LKGKVLLLKRKINERSTVKYNCEAKRNNTILQKILNYPDQRNPSDINAFL